MSVATVRAVLSALLPIATCLAPPAAAQDPSGPYRTVVTAHVRVHARPEHRDVALRAAAAAEAAWSSLAALLPPPGRAVDLVVADHVDYANGFATTYPTPTVVIYAFPPAGDRELGAYDRWLRLVITHELVHVFHLELTRGWWRVARAVFGRVPALFPNEYAPSWLLEGTAVFYESRLTGAGRLGGAYHDAVVEAQVAERGRLPLGAAGALSPRWPGGTRAYAFGSAFVDALAERHGDSIVPRLIRAIARRPIPYLGLNGALGGGLSLGREWREWMDSLQAPGARRQDAQDTPREQVLVPGLRTAGSLRATTDQRRLLFVFANGADEARLAVWHRDVGAVRRLSRINSDDGVAWMGGRALVSQLEFTDRYTVRGDLWTVGPSGDERRMTRGGRLREPDADSGGAIVAVHVVPGGNELVMVERDSLVPLQPVRPDIEWSAPRFSPDGQTIAAVWVVNGHHDIVLMARNGAIIRQVTDDAATDRGPAFTPDGAMVVWSREVDGGPQIVAMRLSDGATFRLTHAPFGAYAPAPAGDSLFYFSYHADGFRLVGVSWDPEPVVLEGDGPTDRRTDGQAPPAAEIVRERRYSPFPALAPHYWLPTFVPAPGGTFAGLFTSSQDPLGRHFYLLDAGAGLGGVTGRWRGSVYYAYAGRKPALVDLSASREHSQYLEDSAGVVRLRCCLAEDNVDLGLAVSRRRWRSGVALRLAGEYERVERIGSRAGVSLAVGAAHAAAAPLAISTQRGWRASATVRRRWRTDDPSLSSRDLVVSAAGYVPVTVFRFARQVVALRGSAGFIGGRDRLLFGVGGVSSGAYALLPGLSLGGGSRDFPVRGYAGSSLVGRTVVSGSLEFRSPLALVGNGPGLFPPVSLDRLSATVFADAGAARSTRNCADSAATRGCFETIGSAGGEVVIDAGIPYDFPVRFRVGAAWRFGLRSAALYAAVGSAF